MSRRLWEKEKCFTSADGCHARSLKNYTFSEMVNDEIVYDTHQPAIILQMTHVAKSDCFPAAKLFYVTFRASTRLQCSCSALCKSVVEAVDPILIRRLALSSGSRALHSIKHRPIRSGGSFTASSRQLQTKRYDSTLSGKEATHEKPFDDEPSVNAPNRLLYRQSPTRISGNTFRRSHTHRLELESILEKGHLSQAHHVPKAASTIGPGSDSGDGPTSIIRARGVSEQSDFLDTSRSRLAVRNRYQSNALSPLVDARTKGTLEPGDRGDTVISVDSLADRRCSSDMSKPQAKTIEEDTLPKLQDTALGTEINLLSQVEVSTMKDEALSAQTAVDLSNKTRSFFRELQYPVVVLTTNDLLSDGYRGITLTSLVTVCLAPRPVISFNIHKMSPMYAALSRSREFLVHALDPSPDGRAIAAMFANDPASPKSASERSEFIRERLQASNKDHCVNELTPFKVSLTPQDSSLPCIGGAGVSMVLRCSLLGDLNGQPHQSVKIGDHMVCFANVVESLDQNEAQSEKSIGLGYGQQTYRGAGQVIEPAETKTTEP